MHPFVETLAGLGAKLVHARRVVERPAARALPRVPLPRRLAEALERQGIHELWSHQAAGLDLARAGRDVLVATPTASGKTLLFASCILESALVEPRSRALLLYPTKALARDQLAGLRELAGGLGALAPPRFEVYDGDTPASRRARIRADPPLGLITNPDMLHLGILPRHADWEPLLANLRWIVLDELHVYRGVFGAHVHHILARLLRLCERYGSRPQIIAASATIGNPGAFARTLVGREFDVVDSSGAPRAALDVAFLNPGAVSPYTVAVRVIAAAVRAGLRTIAFTKARRITELVYTWLVQQEPDLRRRVAPYRSGYLPEERRALEARLFGGDLSAVVSTSALELGIDVGGLDLCVLVGYPGSLVSSWQRIGRVGRRGRAGLVVLVALPDALDQYVVHHPEAFFDGSFEPAVLDPWNPSVASGHLVCAAAEEPLLAGEPALAEPRARAVVDGLVDEGRLVQDAAGSRWFSFRRRPHRDVSPRTSAQPFAIVERASGKLLGRIDGVRVFHECHPGAIYLHGGRSFHVVGLDRDRRRAEVERVRADHYTVVLGDKETRILEATAERRLGPFPVGLGRLEVTVRIREYQKRRLFGGEPISNHPLDLPPLIYETEGLWIRLPVGLPAALTARGWHFMGGIHAAEHATIGLFPLLAIADRGDVGGISYTGHPQTGGPAIFVYDGVPGGAGLARRGFDDLETLIGRTLERVSECACEAGCPGCIQSPSCGNGNKPLDKTAARTVLELLAGRIGLEDLGVAPGFGTLCLDAALAATEPARRHGIRRAGNVEPVGDEPAAEPPGAPQPLATAPTREGSPFFPPARPARARTTDGPLRLGAIPSSERATCPPPADGRLLIFDLETQRSAADVGGWHRLERMGLAVAVTFDVARHTWRTYYEADVHRLLLDLVMADRVVGFNVDRFDLGVLGGYTDQDLGRIRTLDLLGEIERRLGFRISLDELSRLNLGRAKSGDGLQSLRWWREGRIDLIERYCRDDVEATLRLFKLGREQGFLLYQDHAERAVRVPVQW